jgi:hypothetical protein
MNFEATIRLDDTFFTFIFSEIKSGNRLKYFVRTKTQKGEYTFFEIVQEFDGEWMLVQPAPEWIKKHEEKFIALIHLHRI